MASPAHDPDHGPPTTSSDNLNLSDDEFRDSSSSSSRSGAESDVEENGGGSEGSSSGRYSQCRSGNFSSSRSWYHSPDNDVMFGSSDLQAYLHDSGGSGDGFLDALEDSYSSDTDKLRELSGFHGAVRATGLFEEDDEVKPSSSLHEAGSDELEGLGVPSSSLHEPGLDELEPSSSLHEAGLDELEALGVPSSSLHEPGLDELELHAVPKSSQHECRPDELEELAAPSSSLHESEVYEKSSSLLEHCIDLVCDSQRSNSLNESHLDKLEQACTSLHEAGVYEDKHPVGIESRVVLERIEVDSEVTKSVFASSTLEHQVDEVPVSVAESQSAVKADVEPETTLVQVVEKKKCVMRLGSREAEDLLQLDVAEIVKPLRLSSIRTTERGTDWSREHLGPDELSRYVETPEVRETYMDTVWDMEDVLLDTGETSGSHSFWTSRSSSSPVKTSGTRKTVYDGLWKVDSVEVIGARQRRGGASLGERVVGIREHTIYRIRVKSGGKEWEIERRYRDFVDLYQQMKRIFSIQSRVQLPSPWEKVTVESRKLFGNTSPDVVEIRSALLQVCLQSTLQAGVPISTAAPLLRFLFPSPGESRLPMLTASSEFSPTITTQQSFSMPLQELGSPKSDTCKSPEVQDYGNSSAPFGRTIRLVVQVQTKKPLKQQLLNQRNVCAGCYEQLTSTGSLLSGIGKTFGWGNPRFCEYTGQVFCTGCHLNESAVLPARVLQSWDFTPKPVSQLAKAYLDSIYDQPMLCVSAVNPFLYSRVPILAHLRETRRRLNRLVDCIRCPSRSRIQQVLGSRRYLLDYNDFYALRDLTDLSKGAFAVLPGLLRATLEKLSFHVTRKCSVCLELAEPCGAGVVCCAPSDLIYPFQDDGVHRCQLCNTVFHKRCFKMIETCKICTTDSPMVKQQQQQQQKCSSQSADSVEFFPEEVGEEQDSSSKPRKLRSNSVVLNMSAIL